MTFKHKKDLFMIPKAHTLFRRSSLRPVLGQLSISLLVVAFAAVSASVLGMRQADAASATVPDGVHYTITGPTSVSFDWRGGGSTISYGPTSAYGTTVNAGGPVVVKESGSSVSITPSSSTGPFREARLTGLQAGTTYHYTIGGTADKTFHTAPAAGTSDFTVIAEGDTGNSADFSAFQPIQDAIAANGPNLVLGLGDYPYVNGNPTGGGIEAWFGDSALGTSKPGLQSFALTTPFMPIWGNHEIDHANDNGTCRGDNLSNYKSRFDFPHPMEDPVYSSYCNTGGGEDWWWMDYGNVRFIGAPEPWSDDWKTWNTKVDPIMAAAQNDPNINYIVTMDHRPSYSSGYHPGESALANYTGNLHAKYSKFVMALNGHSHNYERTNPAQTKGITYITSGGGGGGLENGSCSNGWNSVNGSCNMPTWDSYRLMHYGFLKLTFSKTGIAGQYVCGPGGGESIVEACTTGSAVDNFSIGSPVSNPVPTPTDTTPPTVSMSAPANNATVSGSVTVSASASDDTGVKQVEFFADNTSLGTDTTAPYSISWNSSSAANGLHTIKAVATDSSTSSNKATSSAVSVTVNNGCTALPTTYGSTTQQMSMAAGTYRVWSRVMVPDTTNNSFYLQVGNACAAVIGDSTSIPANTWTWVDYTNGSSTSKDNVTLATAGSQNIVMTGRETGVRVDRVLLVGDSCTPTGNGDNCTTTPDTTAPSNVALNAPTAGSTVTGPVTIKASAGDNVGVSRVDFYDGSSLIGSSTAPASGTVTNGTWQYTWDTTNASVGAHTLKAVASDGSNTTSSATVNVTVGQVAAPTVTITSPASNTTVQGVVSVTATATTSRKLTKAELYVNGNLTSTSTSTVSPYSFAWNTANVAAGTYTLVVKAYDDAQPSNVGSSSAISLTVNDTIAPSVPANLSAQSVSSTENDLTWSASTDNVGVKGYQVLRNNVVVANPTTTNYKDTSAAPNTTYTYSVKAFDAAGNTSGASNNVTVTTAAAADTTAPTAPSGLVASLSGTSVNVHWNASTDNVKVDHYVVARDNQGVTSFVATPATTSYTDTDVVAGQSYTYRAYAVDSSSNISAASNSATVNVPNPTPVTDTQAPEKPDDLKGLIISDNQINLTWAPSTDNVGVTGYEIWRDDTKVTTLSGTTYGDTTVKPGVSYTYKVYAFDAAGNRSEPASSTVTIPIPPVSTSTNYVLNGTFESNLKGWKILEGSKAKLSRSSDSHTGSSAALLTRVSGRGDVTLNDSGDWLEHVPSGAVRCTATAWVKASTLNRRVVIRLRDYQNERNVGYYTSEIRTPDTNWHQLTVSAPVKSSRDDMDLNIYGDDFGSSQKLWVDDVTETCSNS